MIYELNNYQPIIDETAYVAESAQIIGRVALGSFSSVWFNSVLRGDVCQITIGNNSNFQDGSIAHGDEDFPVTIGHDVTVGHRAILHGCSVGDGSLIGMGAIVLNGAKIGKQCLVAAGALVPEGMMIPDRSVVMGVPAKIVKEVSSALAKRLKYSSEHYLAQIKNYQGLKKL